ncbi:MAG TPA: enolase C-terminal domain-like protein [Acidobacteriaceae bacterium]|nr:enolase C-terminal domain-like protein [Acidobacteriaceae bacterium]
MPQAQEKIAIDRLEVASYTVPTDAPESDGTLEWDHTTVAIVTIHAGGRQGIGYTYADSATVALMQHVLRSVVQGMDALSPAAVYMAMWQRIRNLGRPGVCSMAISAADCALWDLKARILGVPLVTLLGQVRDAVPVYGSGGFTSCNDRELARQLGGWAKEGLPAVKLKIGRDPQRDEERVRIAREAIGPKVRLYADANGAYSPRQALEQADMLAQYDVRWFEEPVSSDNLEGMRFVRDRAPARMEIAAGEYCYRIFDFQRMISAGAVDVLQADVTRCGGFTAFTQVAALTQANNLSLSSHTAPALHVHAACAAIPFSEMEYFHDHVRIERMFFDGLPQLSGGTLCPDLSSPGNGLVLRRADAEKFAA